MSSIHNNRYNLTICELDQVGQSKILNGVKRPDNKATVLIQTDSISKYYFILALFLGVVFTGIAAFGIQGIVINNHSWSMWTTTVGGSSIGISLISYGIFKTCQAILRDKEFGNHFHDILLSDEFVNLRKKYLPKGRFEVTRCSNKSDYYFIIRKTHLGRVECTRILEEETKNCLQKTIMQEEGYVSYIVVPPNRT